MLKRKGFTLIELLVVIAIIALLLSIIMPSMRAAKEKAQFLRCGFNLKAYGITMKLYLDESDDVYPYCETSMFDGTNLPAPSSWACEWHDERISPNNNPECAGPLWPYMASDAAHMCSTFKTFAKVYGEDHDWHDPSIPVNPQYAYSQNGFLGWESGVMKESQVVSPSRTLVWVEETIWEIPGWAEWVLNDTCFLSRHYLDSTFGDFIATYHNTSVDLRDEGLGNAVFVDGHVQLCDPYYTIDLPGGGVARNGFILSWPLKGKRSSTKPY